MERFGSRNDPTPNLVLSLQILTSFSDHQQTYYCVSTPETDRDLSLRWFELSNCPDNYGDTVRQKVTITQLMSAHFFSCSTKQRQTRVYIIYP